MNFLCRPSLLEREIATKTNFFFLDNVNPKKVIECNSQDVFKPKMIQLSRFRDDLDQIYL